MGWIDAGEWLTYDIAVPTSGSYRISVRVASPNTGRSFQVRLNDAPLIGSTAVPRTGHFQTWTTVDAGVVTLSAGTHALTVVADTAGFNLNYLQVTSETPNEPPVAAFTASCAGMTCDFDGSSSTDSDGTITTYAWDFGDGSNATGIAASRSYAFSGTYTVALTVVDDKGATNTSTQQVHAAIPLPGLIQAEDYRVGGAGVGFIDTTTGNTGGAYRNDAVDIQATQDIGGGFSVGWTETGEWLAYDVTVTNPGTYLVTTRVASPNAGSSFHIKVDGVDMTGPVAVPNTGGWQAWGNTAAVPIVLDAGTYTITFFVDNAGFNINYIAVDPQ